jgi:hypothetical protein
LLLVRGIRRPASTDPAHIPPANRRRKRVVAANPLATMTDQAGRRSARGCKPEGLVCRYFRPVGQQCFPPSRVDHAPPPTHPT